MRWHSGNGWQPGDSPSTSGSRTRLLRPAVTLLKPLKGGDATTAASLQSWFNQDYAGPTQILFGVADASDPVCKTVRELIEKNPGRDAQLMVCGESLGTNGKISTLIQLERLAKYELILVSDADVRVPADFLVNAVAPLRDDETALVNCFYRLANPATAAMRWEAIAVNADFWSQVLQAISLKPLDFALGATMLVRRPALAEIGGFNSLADCLADDYQLGHRLAEKGHRLALCPVVVECWDAPMTWRGVWRHQLRWARTIRVLPAPALFFQHPVQRHPLAAALVVGFSGFASKALPCARGHRLPVNPNLPCPKSSAPADPRPPIGFTVLAGAGEGFAANRPLVWRVFGPHGRVARTTDETSSGRNRACRTVSRTADVPPIRTVCFQSKFNPDWRWKGEDEVIRPSVRPFPRHLVNNFPGFFLISSMNDGHK